MIFFRVFTVFMLTVGIACLLFVFFAPSDIAPAFTMLGILLTLVGIIGLALIRYNNSINVSRNSVE
ncbi:MAG: hypothetical protein ACFFDF_04875 [Candidatus Odinarchaeota archaeon]